MSAADSGDRLVLRYALSVAALVAVLDGVGLAFAWTVGRGLELEFSALVVAGLGLLVANAYVLFHFTDRLIRVRTSAMK